MRYAPTTEALLQEGARSRAPEEFTQGAETSGIQAGAGVMIEGWIYLAFAGIFIWIVWRSDV